MTCAIPDRENREHLCQCRYSTTQPVYQQVVKCECFCQALGQRFQTCMWWFFSYSSKLRGKLHLPVHYFCHVAHIVNSSERTGVNEYRWEAYTVYIPIEFLERSSILGTHRMCSSVSAGISALGCGTTNWFTNSCARHGELPNVYTFTNYHLILYAYFLLLTYIPTSFSWLPHFI